jgi:shikimate dehydrogenase
VGRSDEARLFGVLGDPVDHSLSPAMQNAAFAALGLPHLYLRYRVAPGDLRAALGEARRLGTAGLNLTVPLKEAVLPLLDALTPEAEQIGSVNTVVFGRGGLVGHNTDGRGFLQAIAGHVDLRAAHAIVIGAGGSARALGVALVAGGCRRLTIANRTAARAQILASRLAALGGSVDTIALEALADTAILGDAALVVNATPIGLGGPDLRVRYRASPPRCLFVDLVYAPRPTAFLRGAARARRPGLDGAGMLLHQGALAFELWTGRPAPVAAMAGALAAAGLTLTQPRAATSVSRRRPPTP